MQKDRYNMNEDCIFCRIIKGEIPSHKVYEDEDSFAFTDMHPINPGHILVIPKIHTANFYELEEKEYIGLMKAVKKLSIGVQEAIKPGRTGLLVAGWDVPHAHVHIVPLNKSHELTSKAALEGRKANPTDQELEEIAEKIRNQL
jgi:histidine triad (HIT) family protein